MLVLDTLESLKQVVLDHQKKDFTVGLVPTMGALHEGHLSLINRSLLENQCTFVSIFVNPLQFNSADDLAKYPRVLSEDLELLKSAGVDYVFVPTEAELYPKKPAVFVDFGSLSSRLEGEFRKGHFEGVGLVVSKLLHLVAPKNAYFGLKDLQQFLLIRRMCEDLNFPCRIVGVETVRESSGLALSSRNRRLSDKGLITATVLNRALSKIQDSIYQGVSVADAVSQGADVCFQEKDFELEYLEPVDPENLNPISDISQVSELAVCIAGYVEGVRLIDNLYLRLK